MKDNFNRYLWTSLGILFVSIVVAVGALNFLLGDIASRSNAIAVARALVVKQNDSLAAFAEIKQDSAKAAEYKMAMDKLLPAQDELINFPQWLQGVAATYGVTVSFSFTADTAPATPASAGSIGFSLTAEGGNDSVVSFLNDLESKASGFLLSFNSFDLTRDGENTKVVTGGSLFFR
jgi:hypothetical protein